MLQVDNSNKLFSTSYSISTANTWEYKTIRIPGDTSGLINDDNGGGLQLFWWLNSGTDFQGGSYQTSWGSLTNANRNVSNLGVGSANNDYYQITGVQLEVGSNATAFEHRILGDELIRCQRYYEKSYDIDVAPGTANQDGTFHWQSNGASASIASFPARFTVRKRAEPTITVYNPTNGSSGGLRCNNGTNQAAQAYGVGQTGFNFRTTGGATTNNRYVGHYTAEAEL